MKGIGTGLLIILCLSVFCSGCATNMADAKKRAVAKEQFGNSLLREGKYQEALKELMEAAELDPENAGVQNAIGYAYRGLGQYRKAIDHYKKAWEHAMKAIKHGTE